MRRTSENMETFETERAARSAGAWKACADSRSARATTVADFIGPVSRVIRALSGVRGAEKRAQHRARRAMRRERERAAVAEGKSRRGTAFGPRGGAEVTRRSAPVAKLSRSPSVEGASRIPASWSSYAV